MFMTKKKIAVVAAASVFLLAGCSTADSAGPKVEDGSLIVGPPENEITVEIPTREGLREQLPKNIQDRGKLIVAVEANAGLPNSVSTPEGDLRGLVVDTAYALGDVIGIDVELQPTTFDQIIPGLEAGRYDLGTNTFSVTPERIEAVDFVNHLIGVPAVLLVQSDKTDYVDTLTAQDACGLSVAVNKGGTQVVELEEASAQCVADGKPALDIQLYPSNPEALLAVKSGRVEAGIFQYSQTMTYVAGDQTLAAGAVKPGIVAYVGMAIPKGSEAQEPIREAMLELYNSGTWLKILELYNVQDQAPTEEVIRATGVYDPESQNG